jgi:hypothetical protein
MLPTPWRVVQLRATARGVIALGETGIAASIDPATGEVRTISTGVRDAWIADDALYVVRGALGLAGYSLTGVPLNTKTVWTRPVGAVRLLRVGETLAVLVDGDSTLRIVARRENAFVEKAQLDVGAAIRDIALGTRQVFATTEANELLVIDVGDPAHPFVTHRYASAQTIARFAIGDGHAFFAGERKLSSVKLLPGIRFDDVGNGTFAATLPATLPQGAYDIAVSDGDRSLSGLHNAVRVSIRTGRKPAISPERFQELLEQQRR